jgi:hypothetical protein
MPLTWNRKWGIRYLYQPPFTQQLGIFSTLPYPDPLVPRFLSLAQQHFRFAEIFLNYANPSPHLHPHTNFILDLDEPYDRLAARYKKDLVKNLRLAAHTPMRYGPSSDLSLALRLHKESYADRMPHVKANAYTRFEQLCFFLLEKDRLLLRTVSDASGQLLALALLPRDDRRLYLLESTTLPVGRATAANHFLLDGLIREFAGQPLLLDFEGSDLPGIAHFYANFGARDQPYFFYRHNRLPWPLRWLK